jgi:membrane protein required for colicin V production
MTGFDYIVFGILGIAAAGGFMRGFVQEILSLAAWFLAVFAIKFLHSPLTDALGRYMGNDITTSLLAFAALLLIPYIAMKLIASLVGGAMEGSILSPIDRFLGFGFGALKGIVIVVIAFSVLALGYDTIWGFKGRPTWIANARSYELIDASSRNLVSLIAERRERLNALSGDGN